MAIVNQDLYLEIPPGTIPPTLNVTEYDENMQVTVHLLQRGQAFEVPSGTAAKVEGTIAGRPFSVDATADGSTVTFELDKSMTAFSGRAWTKIKLTKDSKPVSTCGFWLDNDRAGVEAETVIGANGFYDTIKSAVYDYLDNQPGVFTAKKEKIFYGWVPGGLALNGNLTTDANRTRTEIALVPEDAHIECDPSVEYRVAYYAASDVGSFVKFEPTEGFTSEPMDILPGYYVRILARYVADHESDIADVSAFSDLVDAYYFAPQNATKDEVFENKAVDLVRNAESYWNTETNTAVNTPFAGSVYYAASPIAVHPGDVFHVVGNQGLSHRTRIWVVVDDDYKIVSKAPDYYENAVHSETITIPAGGTMLLLTSFGSQLTPSPYLWAYKRVFRASAAEDSDKPMAGKVVAIIGDSISTNGRTGVDANVPEIEVKSADVGVTLSAYLTSYDVEGGLSLGGHTFTSDEIGTEVSFTPVAADVGKKIGVPNNYNPNSTNVWWEVARDALGFTPIPVCWSGASMTSHEASTASYKTAHAWHDAQIRKCGIRTPGSMTRTAPDVIIIYRGTNDMTHAPYARLNAEYFTPFNWEYPESDLNDDKYIYEQGVALTIKKLRAAYPDAEIWLCTLNVFKRVNYSHFPTNNGYNSLPQYNDAIRRCADFFGCNVIDFDRDGITFENCYTEGYITDSATTPTHPSDKGHRKMGERAIADLLEVYR